jgi:hypothetical protein
VLQGNYQLPDGPVIISPGPLFTSLHREVIMRKPEIFKIACLKDIQRLFGLPDPFYAGFGNRITGVVSYRSVSVPISNRTLTTSASAPPLNVILDSVKTKRNNSNTSSILSSSVSLPADYNPADDDSSAGKSSTSNKATTTTTRQSLDLSNT